jgi:MoaD family protein
MATVKVSFYGVVKDAVDQPYVEVEIPQGATVRDLLQLLAQRYGDSFAQRVLDATTGIKTYVRIFINDRDIDDLDTPIADGPVAEATVYVLPATMGGYAPE